MTQPGSTPPLLRSSKLSSATHFLPLPAHVTCAAPHAFTPLPAHVTCIAPHIFIPLPAHVTCTAPHSFIPLPAHVTLRSVIHATAGLFGSATVCVDMHGGARVCLCLLAHVCTRPWSVRVGLGVWACPAKGLRMFV